MPYFCQIGQSSNQHRQISLLHNPSAMPHHYKATNRLSMCSNFNNALIYMVFEHWHNLRLTQSR
jgi:hypothetical protein